MYAQVHGIAKCACLTFVILMFSAIWYGDDICIVM